CCGQYLRPSLPALARAPRAPRRRLQSDRWNRFENATNAPRNGRGRERQLPESQRRRAPMPPTSACWQSFWEGIRAGPILVSVRAGMGIPAPLPNRRAVRRRRALAREPRWEADTTLLGPRWNLISAPLINSVVDRKPLSSFNITRFHEMRQCQVGSDSGVRDAQVGTAAWSDQPSKSGACPASLHGIVGGIPPRAHNDSGTRLRANHPPRPSRTQFGAPDGSHTFEVAALASFSTIAAPSCETLPAPSVKIISPG